jgi:hypothetical protein
MNNLSSEMPQDSTLRRHWQSARDMQASTSSSSTNTVSTNTENTTNTVANTSGGGIFSWMKSLFS